MFYIEHDESRVPKVAEIETPTEAEAVPEVACCDQQAEPTDNQAPCTNPAADNESLVNISNCLSSVEEKVASIDEILKKTKDELHQLHRLYHNEYAGRLRNVEAELNRYQEIEKGRAFDGILGEIARLYSDNVAAVSGISDERIKKQMGYMFDDFLQLLENNGVTKQESANGDKRNSRHCQVVERVKTTNPDAHDTVVESLNIGFVAENRTLVKERIHLYIYDENANPQNITHQEA